MADILYTYKNSVYANITNKCNCSCTFCIRSLKDGVGSADTLWHQQNPTTDEVLNAIRNYDFEGFDELVFCGYGEPTCALETLLAAAKVAKEEKNLRTRLNTNGLGNEENGKNIVPEIAKVIDAVSISLNAPNSQKYSEVTRPKYDGAFDKMVDFATKCKEEIKDVKWSIVDVLPEEDIAKCKALSESTGIELRIRHFT
ncbi:radical SAM enzyme, TIGR04100 family [Butyrivibrio sp. INlla18]|uniref:TIGR04100 family radical SAM protein n=1 Tax=Butyrivibrio sp. INlla18 TaxID=1520806 RepID=UPI0008803FF1|nr:TIGR04100 family radical SAM protein [Butyrivibrio sp. INlla18]SDA62299.1 radical SAM enzyme, TIGR04100 family [Butyrivibrio sp. INlla18]